MRRHTARVDKAVRSAFPETALDEERMKEVEMDGE